MHFILYDNDFVKNIFKYYFGNKEEKMALSLCLWRVIRCFRID